MDRKTVRILILALAFGASIARADLLDKVISRATDLTGPSFQSCGDISTDDGEDCFLRAYDHKLTAIGTFNIAGRAAEARVLTAERKLITISAYSDKSGLTEESCKQPFIAIEFTKRRVRCKNDYRPPLGATILTSRPVWLTKKEELPVAIEHPQVPGSVCKTKPSKIIAQQLVDVLGTVPEVQLIVVPKDCSAKKVEEILKRWRYTPPTKDGKPINTVIVLEVSLK